jgi:hypothetical protein
MKITAFPILSLHLAHAYYLAGKWKGLRFEVAPLSAKTMASKQLQIRQIPGGCMILRQREDFRGATNISAPQRPFWLRLYLHVADPDYFNYTALPYGEIRKETLYFSNVDLQGNFQKSPQITTCDTVTAADFVAHYPQQFIWLNPAAPGEPLVVRDWSLQSVWETTLDPQGKASIDLSTHELGRYTVQVGTQSPVPIVTILQGAGKPAAIFDLLIDPRRPAFLGTAPENFNLRFEAREIYWRFIIQLGKVPYTPDAVSIRDQDQALTFAPGEFLQQDDEPQLCILSSSKVKLQERYPYLFDLVQNSNNRVLATRLPFPSLRYLKKHPAIQNEYIADAYVSL